MTEDEKQEAIKIMAEWTVDKLCIQFCLTPDIARDIFILAQKITERGIK